MNKIEKILWGILKTDREKLIPLLKELHTIRQKAQYLCDHFGYFTEHSETNTSYEIENLRELAAKATDYLDRYIEQPDNELTKEERKNAKKV